jgi:hypothetical protein
MSSSDPPTDDTLILEGIVTTVNDDGSVNVSPMGPRVDRGLTHFTLRPFNTSRTYHNLKRIGEAVFHVVDDVNLLARAAVGRLDPLPPLRRLANGRDFVLVDACRWFALRTTSLDDSRERVTIECRVADQATLRDFFGWNRAKHAVLEAAILATRIGIVPDNEIRDELARLAPLIDKAAGDQEREAMRFLQQYVDQRLSH